MQMFAFQIRQSKTNKPCLKRKKCGDGNYDRE